MLVADGTKDGVVEGGPLGGTEGGSAVELNRHRSQRSKKAALSISFAASGLAGKKLRPVCLLVLGALLLPFLSP